jgi:hypothetical protein
MPRELFVTSLIHLSSDSRANVKKTLGEDDPVWATIQDEHVKVTLFAEGRGEEGLINLIDLVTDIQRQAYNELAIILQKRQEAEAMLPPLDFAHGPDDI